MSTSETEIPLLQPTPFQPELPPEANFTDAELTFMEEEPPGLFPDNQDSNFGWIIRKSFSDFVQDIADDQTTIYNERFVNTSTAFLDQWALEVGLPPQSGTSVAQQRASILGRLQRGPFTRERRDKLIEDYIAVTFGNTIQLTPEGLALVAGGVPLYSEPGEVTDLYTVVEDQENFHYTVNIDPDTDPNIDALTAELERITPAGITFTITRASAFTYEERMATYPNYQDVLDAGKHYKE